MLNQAQFPKAKELAKTLLEVFSALPGNSRSFDPMIAGEHEVVVIKAEKRKSKKGKPMMEVKLRSLNDGRDITTYIMKFRKWDWDKWKNIKVGQTMRIDLSFSNGFATVKQKYVHKDVIDIPLKPSKALTKQTIILFDIEVFKRDNLFVFRDYFTKEWFVINNDLNALRKFYLEYRDSMFIGYNNYSYDNTVMRAYLQGKSAYQLSKAVIESDDRSIMYQMFDNKKTPLFGMDLYQDNKGFSLKEHSAFLGINIKETEVDFDMERELTEDEKIKNILYCKNDVLATEKRFEQQIGMLLAKAVIALMFNEDKSSLLMTNANLTADLLGAERHEVRSDLTNPLELPKRLNIEIPEIRQAYLNREFELNEKGKLNVALNFADDNGYEMVYGSGGVHGAIPSFIQIGRYLMRDFGSLYPNVMIQFGLLSRNIPADLEPRYGKLLQQRMDAKYSGEENANIKGLTIPTSLMINGIKLPLNTKFGAEGAPFNALYDPRNQFLVCVMGQLIMTEFYEIIKPHVDMIQSNTDCHAFTPKSDEDERIIDEKLKEFSERIGITLDKDEFVEMWQKDVNNYIAVDAKGKVKIKGAVGLTGGMKVSNAVVSNAFINYLVSGKDYREFIEECEDLRQFQIITKTGWTFDETIARLADGTEVPAQKVNRCFAVKDPEKKVELFKVKHLDKAKVEVNKDEEVFETHNNKQYVVGLANAPEIYTISNEAVGEGIQLEEVDKEYYVQQVEALLELWFGPYWKDRIDNAHAKRKQLNLKPLPVKNYID